MGARLYPEGAQDKKALCVFGGSGRVAEWVGTPETGLHEGGRAPGPRNRCVRPGRARSRGALRGTRRRRRAGSAGSAGLPGRAPGQGRRFPSPSRSPERSPWPRLRGAAGRREKPESLEAETRRPFPGASGRSSARGRAGISEESRGLPAAAPHALPRREPRRSRGPDAAAGRLIPGSAGGPGSTPGGRPRRPRTPRAPPGALPSHQTAAKPVRCG